MNFTDAIKSFFSNAFNIHGRSSKSEFWWVFLGFFGIGVIIGILKLPEQILNLMNLIVLVPGVTLAVRRFHDANLSGWYYLGLFIFTLMAVFSVAATIDLSTITQEALIKKMGMIYIICLLSACIPGFLNGTKGDNKYGENPLDKDKMK